MTEPSTDVLPIKQPKRNVAIRASAGSGKTFTLTKRYLELLFQGVPPDRILATTFTRKAAGEILSRIVGRLAESLLNPTARAQLQKDLGLESLEQGDVEKQFLQIVDRLSGAKIGTLDRFFAVAARGLSLELGLPTGWNVLDTTADADLRSESLGDLLAGNSGKELAQLCRLLSKGEVHRQIYQQVDELVTELHEVHGEASQEAWEALPRSAELSTPELESYLDTIERFPLSQPVSLAKARDKDIEAAREARWIEFVSKGIGPCVISGTLTYSRTPLPEALVPAYEAVCRHASAVLRNRLVVQNSATYQLLAKFDAHYRDKQFRAAGIRFSDVTALLARAITDEVSIWPSGPNGITHLLLDEFQDTSTLQWRVLAPLARQCARSESGSFFCVGDPKQAIYRWRGGVAELFDTLPNEVGTLEWHNLSESYRSSPVIIEFVNRVFESLPDNPVFAGDTFLRGVACKWSERFQTHRSARTEKPGYVRLLVAPAEAESTEDGDLHFSFAAHEIAHLRDQSPGASIGVLVRENRAVARMLGELRQLGLEASEEGGNPLSRHPAVSLILSFLDWLDHPGSSASLFHVSRSPLGTRLGITPSSSDEDRAAIAGSWRRLFVERGYGEAIRRLVDMLEPGLSSPAQNGLEQLIEQAIDYEKEGSLRPSAFVRHVELTKVEDPSRSTIRVMTIHQSKGLEFDIVVLPELDKLLRGQVPRFVVGRKDPTSPIEAICRYTNQEEQRLLPENFRKMFEGHKEADYIESLCILYVALTRAIHSLHMIIAPGKPNERKLPATFSGVVRGAVCPNVLATSETVLFELGDPDWSNKAVPPELPIDRPAITLSPIRWKSNQ